MDRDFSFYSLFILCAIAFLVPLVIYRTRYLKIPVAIAEIIIGIAVGKSGINIVRVDPILEFLSLFGFTFLMFLSGLEIDFHYLKKFTRVTNHFNPLGLGFKVFGLTVALSFVFANVLKGVGITKNPLFLTLIFSTTSLGIVVPALKAKQIISRPVGQMILVVALIADFGTILMIPAVMFFIAGTKSINLVYSFLLVGFFGLIFYTGKKFFKFNLNNSFLETSQFKIRAAFALILFFVTLAEIAGIEIILGAFLAGVLYSVIFTKFRAEITPKLESFGYGFLIPIFFIMVGAKFDLKPVLSFQVLLLLPLFIYIIYIVKMIPALVFKKYFSWRETIGAGFLISSRLSLIIALSLVALKEGLITTMTHSTFILLAMITCLASPLLFMKIYPEP
jgi:Kef-type K+ transport system membrane component KefB